MKIYKSPTEEEFKILKKYIKPFEEVRVSEPALYAGNTYKEVVFRKKVMGNISKNGECYLYLDSNNNVVSNKTTLARLGNLFFFMDAFLNDEPGSIIAALQTEDDIEKSRNDLELIGAGLDVIDKKKDKYIKSFEIENIKKIIIRVMEMRKTTDEKLKIFLDAVNEEMSKRDYFDESVIEACMPEYKNVMLCNYEKVKVIARGADSYSNVKRITENLRRKYNLLFVTSHTEALMKVNYIMRYYDNLLRAYDSILKMSPNQYLKNIANAGKQNAEFKMIQLRN